MVAYVLPLLFVEPGHPFHRIGLIPLTAGTILLLWCVREFYVAGQGTLAPWTPPTHLVVSGPYRYSRNPMYVAVTIVLFGWAIAFRSRALTSYALVMMAVFYVRVVAFEEPWLAVTHGDGWVRYKTHAPRWLGRRRPA